VQQRTGLGPRRVGRILNLGHDAMQQSPPPVGVEETVEAVLARAEAQRRLDRSRVEMMRAFAETDRCRMQFLLAYFGEHMAEVCGHCDTCEAGTSHAEGDDDASTSTPYDVGSDVTHRAFGHGSVVDVDRGALTVLFDDVGYRTLDAEIVESKGLLEETGDSNASAAGG
jgi:ATP-dependent DNA helicase RecQ